MMPRICDLTVNKYLSRESNNKERFMINYKPCSVPWKTGKPEIDRRGFFNKDKKRDPKSKIVLNDKTSNLYLDISTNQSFFSNNTDISMNIINTLPSTSITSSTSPITYRILNNNNLYVSYDDEMNEGIFDNGIKPFSISQLIPWRKDGITDNKFMQKIPWSTKKLSIMDEMDFVDCFPYTVPWKDDDPCCEDMYRGRKIPWNEETDNTGLNDIINISSIETLNSNISYTTDSNITFSINYI